jgi:murein DD-endopeptidase MepM/ murein hydrolase activator NlpD
MLSLLAILGMLSPVGAAADPPTQADLDRVRERLEAAREGLRTVETQRTVTLADLERIGAERARLETELVALTAELSAAEAALGEAERALAITTAELVKTQAELEATRAELDRRRQIFAERARDAFKFGGVGYAEVVVEVRDVEDFTRTMEYVQSIMAADRDELERIAALERKVESTASVLAVLQERQDAQRIAAINERDRVAGLVGRQRNLRDEAVAAERRQQEILAQLESDRGAYIGLVDALEAESAALEQELRRQAEEARRRAAEEAARGRSRRPGGSGSRSSQRPGALLWPADGPKTSGFGVRIHPLFGTARVHTGLDIGAPTGTPIHAAADGVVYSAGWRGGYGNAVVVDHGGGMTTLYAHQSRVAVSGGKQVSRGDVVGYVGSTGFSTGPHLHFEVRLDGEPVDPEGYL